VSKLEKIKYCTTFQSFYTVIVKYLGGLPGSVERRTQHFLITNTNDLKSRWRL